MSKGNPDIPQIVIDPSCNAAWGEIAPLHETHRLTVVCGLVAITGSNLESAQVALVQTTWSAQQESKELGLGFPQGGIEPDEPIVAAYFREIREETQPADLRRLRTVVGLPMGKSALTGGRPRDGKSSKAYGVLCGVIAGEPPELTPNNDEDIAVADWYPLKSAWSVFRTQSEFRPTSDRGKRNQRILGAIVGLDLPRLARPFTTP